MLESLESGVSEAPHFNMRCKIEGLLGLLEEVDSM